MECVALRADRRDRTGAAGRNKARPPSCSWWACSHTHSSLIYKHYPWSLGDRPLWGLLVHVRGPGGEKETNIIILYIKALFLLNISLIVSSFLLFEPYHRSKRCAISTAARITASSAPSMLIGANILRRLPIF